MPELLIRPTTSADDATVLAIHNHINAEVPPVSLEEYRRWMSYPADAQIERYVAEVNGQVVGSTDLREETQLARPNTYLAYLEVDEAHRCHGIGSQLFDLLIERLSVLGAERVYGTVRTSSKGALEFVERRGFVRSGKVDRSSYLDVHEAKIEGLAGLEERLRAEGIHIRTVEEIGMEDDAFMHALFDLEDRTARDIPGTEEHGESNFEDWLDEQMHGTGKSPRWYWVALDGDRPVGLARLRIRGERSAGNGLTAVDRAYRGRKIAQALKLRTILWARENGIDRLYTGNEVGNRPMLAINVALGYQPLSEMIEVVRELRP